jgi:hypothetical protein
VKGHVTLLLVTQEVQRNPVQTGTGAEESRPSSMGWGTAADQQVLFEEGSKRDGHTLKYIQFPFRKPHISTYRLWTFINSQ